MLRCPLDERFHHYGYEDVLFGESHYRRSVITIVHIDNPLAYQMTS